jgi:hypothetical protein
MPKNSARKISRAGSDVTVSAARRARYVDAFIANGQNYVQAARDIGVRGEKACKHFAGRMSADLQTQAMIKMRLEELAAPHAMNAKRAVDLLVKLVLNDRRKFYNDDGTLKDVNELDFDTQLALDGFDVEKRVEFGGHRKKEAEITTSKVKLGKRSTYLDMLFKHFGLYAKDNAQRNVDPDEVAAQVRARLAEIDSSTGGKK